MPRLLPMRFRILDAGRFAVAALALALLGACGGDDDGGSSLAWRGAWTAAEHALDAPRIVEDTTIRQVVRVAIGGERVRLLLSNRFGTTPLEIESASLARSAENGAIATGSARLVSFGGAPRVSIPAGEAVRSDAIDFDVSALDEVAVSIYFAARSAISGTHSIALRPAFFADGDQTVAPSITAELPGFSTTGGWFILAGLDVESDEADQVVVAIGDSITDGFGSVEINGSWPERLAERLAGRLSILNSGISGNRLLRSGLAAFGPSLLDRLDRDVLDQPGVTAVVVLIGINDLQAPAVPTVFQDDPPSPVVTSDDLIAGLRDVIRRSREKGLRVIGGTLVPYETLPRLVASAEDARSELNRWIRDSGELDAVIDFEAAIRDPGDPLRIAPEYDSGDTLHPNDAGYQAMADAAFAVMDNVF